MAPSARSIHHHAARRLARHLARRSSLPGNVSPTSVVPASQIAPRDITLPPTGASALIGTVVILSFFVFGLVGWTIWVYRSKKKSANFPPEKHHGLFDAVSIDSKSQFSISSASRSFTLKSPEHAVVRERSAAELKMNLGYWPKVVHAVSKAKQIPTSGKPGITVTPAPPTLQIIPPSSYGSVPAPALSPRTDASKSPHASGLPSAKLPRLVVVESTFTVTLHDELQIREGEILRLLEEYEDEWCLVQRVGSNLLEKGVVPRFCVIDKPDVTQKRTGVSRFPFASKV